MQFNFDEPISLSSPIFSLNQQIAGDFQSSL